MATLNATVVSNGAEIDDREAVQQLLDEYQFDGIDARIDQIRSGNGTSTTDVVFLSGHNHCGLRILRSPEDDPDRENRQEEFFEALADYLVEPLVVQCIGTEKQRFPAVAVQYSVFPTGKVRCQSLTPSAWEEDGGFDVVLHLPCEKVAMSVAAVDHVDVEYGSQNVATVEYVDGTTETFEEPGLSIAGVTRSTPD